MFFGSKGNPFDVYCKKYNAPPSSYIFFSFFFFFFFFFFFQSRVKSDLTFLFCLLECRKCVLGGGGGGWGVGSVVEEIAF